MLVVDDNSPDGTGDCRRPARRGRPARARPAPARQAGARGGLPRRVRLGRWSAGTTCSSRWTPTAPTGAGPAAAAGRARPTPTCVIGSRWVPGGRVVNWPRSREALSRGGNAYTRAMLGIPRPRRHRRLPRLPARGAASIDLASVDSQGYCFQVDLTWRALAAGFRVVEVPITFVEREHGREQDEPGDRRRGAGPGHRVGVQQRLGGGCARPSGHPTEPRRGAAPMRWRGFLVTFVVWPVCRDRVAVAIAQQLGWGPVIAVQLLASLLRPAAAALRWSALALDVGRLATGEALRRRPGRPQTPDCASSPGLLLFIPGFISDAVGLLLTIPPVRRRDPGPPRHRRGQSHRPVGRLAGRLRVADPGARDPGDGRPGGPGTRAARRQRRRPRRCLGRTAQTPDGGRSRCVR